MDAPTLSREESLSYGIPHVAEGHKSPSTVSSYRPEVDGLRAVAILSVLAFHAGFGAPGGYVGVDVFFVISGYLIVGQVWKDLESGRFTFASFWERRTRRLAPALAFVTVAVLVAGWFLLTPTDFAGLGRAAAWQAACAANVWYWLSLNYFGGAADEKPLLHAWSLAVEEQFYILVPVALWVLYRLRRRNPREAVTLAVAVTAAASFAFSVHQVAHSQTAAFYLLPSRTWELALGALLALTSETVRAPRIGFAREVIAAIGGLFVAMPIALYGSRTPFPGLAAVPACVGTALLIWVDERDGASRLSAVGRLLSTRPLVFIGLISYSLYLWHWPLLAFARYASLGPVSPVVRAALAVAGFGAAVVSWKYVETPFRKRRIGRSRAALFAYAAAGLAVTFGAGVAIRLAHGVPQRFQASARNIGQAAPDAQSTRDVTAEDVRRDRLVVVGHADPAKPPTVLVWGDSHAMAALPAIGDLLDERALAGRAAVHASTAPTLNWYKAGEFGLGRDAVAFGDAVLAYIRTRRIRTVILVASWNTYDEGVNERGDPVPLRDALVETVRRISEAGAHPYVVLAVPRHSFDVQKAVVLPFYSAADVEALCLADVGLAAFGADDPSFVTAVEAAGGRVVDPRPRFLDPTGRYYRVNADGLLLYSDSNHLTPAGARLLLLPLLRDEIALEPAD